MCERGLCVCACGLQWTITAPVKDQTDLLSVPPSFPWKVSGPLPPAPWANRLHTDLGRVFLQPVGVPLVLAVHLHLLRSQWDAAVTAEVEAVVSADE